MATHREIRKAARQITNTQQDIQTIHQQTQESVQSLESMNRALQGAIGKSARMIRGAGLMGRDRKMALSELASRRVDAAAGASFAVRQTQQTAAKQLASLYQDLGNYRSDYNALLQEKAQQKAQQAATGGLTPTQQRAERASKISALQAAGQLYRITKSQGGTPGAGGKAGPTWDQFIQQVAKAPGVTGPNELQHATNAVGVLRMLLSEKRTGMGPQQGFPKNVQHLASRRGTLLGNLP
jgi:hypothetical protein